MFFFWLKTDKQKSFTAVDYTPSPTLKLNYPLIKYFLPIIESITEPIAGPAVVLIVVSVTVSITVSIIVFIAIFITAFLISLLTYNAFFNL